MRNEKRKRNLVHRGIQYALLRRLLLHWMLFVGVTGSLTIVLQVMLDPMQAPVDRNNQIRVAITSLALASFGLVPVFVADSIKLSNRFVGPIVRLQTVIRQVGKGKPVELKFRDGDFWTDLPDDFNRMVERLEARSPSKWWEPGSESELVNAATTSES